MKYAAESEVKRIDHTLQMLTADLQLIHKAIDDSLEELKERLSVQDTLLSKLQALLYGLKRE